MAWCIMVRTYFNSAIKSHYVQVVLIRAADNITDSRDMGFYMGIPLSAVLESFCRNPVLLAYQTY